MIILKTILGIIGFVVLVVLVYILSRVAAKGALTEIEKFFKTKKDDITKS
jgi:hypothetical protein